MQLRSDARLAQAIVDSAARVREPVIVVVTVPPSPVTCKSYAASAAWHSPRRRGSGPSAHAPSWVGLVFVSRVGLELACKGKTVVVAAGNPVAGTSFVHTVADAAAYQRLLEPLYAVAPGSISSNVRRLALRFTYLTMFRIPIHVPLVAMPMRHTSKLAYNSLDALAPGREPGLDRCVGILLDGLSVEPPSAR